MVLKEQQQLRKIRRGDIRSFETLFHTHYQGMLAYARSLVRQEETAEEVVQDVFYNVWKNREEIRINQSWKSYLFRAVYNNSMMALRRSKRLVNTDDGMTPDRGTETGNPLLEMEFGETLEQYGKVLDGFPERTREIFLMNRQEGLKYREIALKLGISEKTVEAHMGRALKAFREKLIEQDVQEKKWKKN